MQSGAVIDQPETHGLIQVKSVVAPSALLIVMPLLVAINRAQDVRVKFPAPLRAVARMSLRLTASYPVRAVCEARYSVASPGSEQFVPDQRTILFPDGTKILAYDIAKAKSTFRFKGNESHEVFWRTKRLAQPPCNIDALGRDMSKEAETVGTPETVNGLEAYRITMKMDANIQQWRALALGCAIVKQVVGMRGQDGRISGVSTQVLSTFRQGDPRAELFAIPDYEEMTPSALMDRVWQVRLGGKGKPPAGAAAELDRRYLLNRP